MKGKAIRIGVGLTAAFLLTVGLALAKTVTLDGRAKLADGPMLNPGSYNVKILNQATKPEVDFYKGGQLVARASVKLQPLTRKASNTAVYYDTSNKPPVITGIELGGSKDKLVFTGTGSSTHASK
jgi:hypothetical protein